MFTTHWGLVQVNSVLVQLHTPQAVPLQFGVATPFGLGTVKLPPLMLLRSETWTGVGIVQNSVAKVELDLSHPTDKKTEAQRPDLILTVHDCHLIWIMEVACAWDCGATPT